jgi:hypothetical protein
MERSGGNVTRKLTLWLVFLAASISALAQISFCPGDHWDYCGTTTGADGKTIAVPRETEGFEGLSFAAYWFFGDGSYSFSSDPWYLLLAVPNDVGGAPGLIIVDGYPTPYTDAGTFLPTTTGSIYDFAAGLTGISGGDGSMSADNMFGSDEQSVFGSTPTSFEVFVYSVDGILAPNTGGSILSYPNLVAGTFLAGIGGKREPRDDFSYYVTTGVFSTSFTFAGLVTGDTPTSGPTTTTTGPTTTTSGPGGGPPGGPVPEPSSIVLLGSALVAVTAGLRKKLIPS